VRVRTVAVLVLAAGFLLWNAIYDHVVIVAGDLYVVVARVAASHGAEALIADWMGPARGVALWTASTITAAALVAALALALLRWPGRHAKEVRRPAPRDHFNSSIR
jgi:hypothetical protein